MVGNLVIQQNTLYNIGFVNDVAYLLVGLIILLNGHPCACGYCAGIGGCFGNFVDGEVFDEAICVWKLVLKFLKAIFKVELTFVGYGLFDMKHQAFAKGNVFNMKNGRIGAHHIKNMIQTRLAVVNLL